MLSWNIKRNALTTSRKDRWAFNGCLDGKARIRVAAQGPLSLRVGAYAGAMATSNKKRLWRKCEKCDWLDEERKMERLDIISRLLVHTDLFERISFLLRELWMERRRGTHTLYHAIQYTPIHTHQRTHKRNKRTHTHTQITVRVCVCRSERNSGMGWELQMLVKKNGGNGYS